jgi:RNA polymerase sigma factor (sigma-70 family)
MDINQLYRDAIEGNTTAEKRLFAHLAVSFRSFIRLKDVSEDDSEDIVQVALLRIFENYRQVEIHSSFAGWAHEVLRNTLFDHFRQLKSERQKTRAIALEHESAHGAAPNPRLKEELRQCLRAIHKRNPRYSRVLYLHFKGYSTQEICARENMTSNSLYVMLSRAREALRDCLKKKGVLSG